MPRKPKIVVGTDLATSDRAVARAEKLAAALGASVHLVHATSRLPRALKKLVAEGATNERRERDALAAIVDDYGSSGVAAEAHLAYGAPAACIRKTARSVGAALVVLGSRGRPLVDAILGSTAERVLEDSGPPVLLAREKGARAYRRAVLALAADSDVARALAAARLVAGEAPISAVHACEGPFENKLLLGGARAADMALYRRHVVGEARERIEPRLADAGLPARTLRILYGSPARVLPREAVRGTLLVLDRGKSQISHALFGSISRQVIERGEGDILLV